MKEKKSIKRCLALLLALTMVISGMTIPEKKATAAEDTTVANEATEANDASVEYVAQIGEQSYATFAEALGVANVSTEDVTIKLLANIEVTDAIEINNTNGRNITIDGANGDERYTLTTRYSSDRAIQVMQKSGNVTFRNMNIVHDGKHILLCLGYNFSEKQDRDLIVDLENMNIVSTSTYEWCLMGVQEKGEFTINMTNVNVDWNGDHTVRPARAFLRCGDGKNNQTVNLTTTGCTINVADAAKTQGMNILAKVSGKFAVPLNVCKGSFGLDAPVHPQHRSFFAGNVCKTLLPLPFKFPGYLQPFEPFLFRRLPVPASDTFRLVRTPLALMALI